MAVALAVLVAVEEATELDSLWACEALEVEMLLDSLADLLIMPAAEVPLK